MKKIFLYFISVLLYGVELSAQDLHFDGTEDKMLLMSGCRVTVDADSAFIISKATSVAINQRLDQLDSLWVVYSAMSNRNKELCDGISQSQVLLSKLKTDMENDSEFQNRNLDSILVDLDNVIATLRSNNLSLQVQNETFSIQVKKLKSVVKKLKQETRWVWWNGCTDKIVAFVGGVGVGVLFCLLFR